MTPGEASATLSRYKLQIFVDDKPWANTSVIACHEKKAVDLKIAQLKDVFVGGVTVQVESRNASKRFVQNKDTQDGISDLSIDAIERSRSNGGPANRTAGG
jgi:hypothetical protein